MQKTHDPDVTIADNGDEIRVRHVGGTIGYIVSVNRIRFDSCKWRGGANDMVKRLIADRAKT